MATAPVKSPLHNFPKKLLQWNTVKETSNTQFGTTSSPCDHPSSEPPPPLPPSVPVGSRSARPRRPPDDRNAAIEHPPEESEKLWNLRPRRATAMRASGTNNGGGDTAWEKTTRSRDVQANNGVGGSGGVSEKRGNEKKKFWITLSKEEIEEDIFAMTGAKPSRRPKRRPKNIQKQLDNVSPGLWLVGMSPDAYRTFDTPPKK